MSKNNQFELHDSRLGTTDESGHRIFQHPEDVKGPWRYRRTLFYWFLILVYLVLPWIHFKGKQIILLDIPGREFTFFGNTFLSHNAPLSIFLILGFVFTIGFITSIWGRVWCGWACPQTVFIDAIYRKLEAFAEGNARQRKKLDEEPWSAVKLAKRTLKWLLFLTASLHISHSFLGYFVGTRKLFWITMESPNSHPTLFIIMVVITLIILLDFGWFREQFCIIACPYGRMQSVIMDEHSLIIAYDHHRGEPRRQPGMAKNEHGDCINCYACVRACPTGIDIRRGTQLECIACTNCIDACDDIMEKIHLPKGLIRYDSQSVLDGGQRKVLRPRNLIYLLAIFGILIGFFFALKSGGQLGLTILGGDKTPFREITHADGTQEIINHFRFVFDNEGQTRQLIRLQLKPLDPNIAMVIQRNPFEFEDNLKTINLTFRFPNSILTKGSKVVTIEAIDEHSQRSLLTKEFTLVGPTQ